MNSSTSRNPNAWQDLLKRNPGLTTRTYHFIGRNPSYISVNTEALKRIEQVKTEKLDELDLSNLALTVLPGEVFELIDLRALNLSGNKLTTLPEEMGQLKELRILAANDNPISTLHEKISELQHLVTLSLEHCQLKFFPEGLLKIHSLKSLQLQGNQISEIPAGLKDMEIEEINFMENPISNIPKEFLFTTSARLFNYFDDREKNKNTRNFKA